MIVPKTNQFNDTNGDIFMSQVNNREAWSKNVGNANMIRRNFVREKRNNIFNKSSGIFNNKSSGQNISMVENKNNWQSKINNRENGGKFMGSARHYVNNARSYPQGADMINTVY